MSLWVAQTRGQQIFQKSGSHFKIYRCQKGYMKKFHTEDSQILGASMCNNSPGWPCTQDLCTPGLHHVA